MAKVKRAMSTIGITCVFIGIVLLAVARDQGQREDYTAMAQAPTPNPTPSPPVPVPPPTIAVQVPVTATVGRWNHVKIQWTGQTIAIDLIASNADGGRFQDPGPGQIDYVVTPYDTTPLWVYVTAASNGTNGPLLATQKIQITPVNPNPPPTPTPTPPPGPTPTPGPPIPLSDPFAGVEDKPPNHADRQRMASLFRKAVPYTTNYASSAAFKNFLLTLMSAELQGRQLGIRERVFADLDKSLATWDKAAAAAWLNKMATSLEAFR